MFQPQKRARTFWTGESEKKKRRPSSKGQLLESQYLRGITLLQATEGKRKHQLWGASAAPRGTLPGTQRSFSEAANSGLPNVKVPGGWDLLPENPAHCGANILSVSKMLDGNWGIQPWGLQLWGPVNIILIGCDP